MRSALIRSLEAAGEQYVVLNDGSSGSAVVIPRAGRVMGLYDASDRNFLWTPAELDTPEGAKALLHDTVWHNLGGDRTWIGPEVGTRVPDLADPLGTIVTPACFDPGGYSLEMVDGTAQLSTKGEIRYYRPDATCGFVAEKTIRLVSNPLRRGFAAHSELEVLSFVGYEQVTHLHLTPPVPADAPLCLWSLPVLPGGGDIIIPTIFRAEVRDFMGHSDANHVTIEEDFVRFNLDGQKMLKIGIKPEALTGRMGYLRPGSGNESTLVVRNFFVDPSAAYVDVPWDGPSDLGYAIEIYNNGGDDGCFGEMEYHTPAVGGATGLDSYVDSSQLWAFRGEHELIRLAAERLLGSGVPD